VSHVRIGNIRREGAEPAKKECLLAESVPFFACFGPPWRALQFRDRLAGNLDGGQPLSGKLKHCSLKQIAENIRRIIVPERMRHSQIAQEE
jgi:hypothetical protein